MIHQPRSTQPTKTLITAHHSITQITVKTHNPTIGNRNSLLPAFNQSNAFGYCGEFGFLEAVRIRLSPSLFAQLISTQPAGTFTSRLPQMQDSVRMKSMAVSSIVAPNSCSVFVSSQLTHRGFRFQNRVRHFLLLSTFVALPAKPLYGRASRSSIPKFPKIVSTNIASFAIGIQSHAVPNQKNKTARIPWHIRVL